MPSNDVLLFTKHKNIKIEEDTLMEMKIKDENINENLVLIKEEDIKIEQIDTRYTQADDTFMEMNDENINENPVLIKDEDIKVELETEQIHTELIIKNETIEEEPSHVDNSSSFTQGHHYTGGKHFLCDLTRFNSLTIINTGDKKRRFSWDTCDQTTFTKPINIVKRMDDTVDESSFSCNICNKIFQRRDSLFRHKRLHTGEKSITCDVCHKTFIDQYNLVRHKRIHTGEKPFACDLCGKTYSQQSTLSRHRSIHTGEKPFECDVCEKTFNRLATLVQHKRIHTGEKPFSCDVCDQTFSVSSALARHKRVHNDKKPFSCDICGQIFLRGSSLANHKRIHKDKLPC